MNRHVTTPPINEPNISILSYSCLGMNEDGSYYNLILQYIHVPSLLFRLAYESTPLPSRLLSSPCIHGPWKSWSCESKNSNRHRRKQPHKVYHYSVSITAGVWMYICNCVYMYACMWLDPFLVTSQSSSWPLTSYWVTCSPFVNDWLLWLPQMPDHNSWWLLPSTCLS